MRWSGGGVLGGGQNGIGVCVGERGQGIQCCAVLEV